MSKVDVVLSHHGDGIQIKVDWTSIVYLTRQNEDDIRAWLNQRAANPIAASVDLDLICNTHP